MNKLVILIIGVIFYLSFLPCNSDCKEIITDSKDSTLNFTEHYIVLEFRVDMLLNKLSNKKDDDKLKEILEKFMYNRAQYTSVNDIDILKNILSQERFSLKTFFGSEFENESAIGNNLKEKIQNEFNSSYQTLLTRFKNYKNAWLLHIDTVETYRIILTLRNFDKMEYIRRILQKTAKLTIQIADNQSDDKNSILSGDIVKTASFVIDSLSKKTIVTIELNGQSASDWKNITEKNIGEKFSLNLDGYSYATFPIESVNNTGIIKFEYKNNLDVSVINAVLNSGSYNAPFQIIEERRFCND